MSESRKMHRRTINAPVCSAFKSIVASVRCRSGRVVRTIKRAFLVIFCRVHYCGLFSNLRPIGPQERTQPEPVISRWSNH
jgi:hypothetical protein